MKATKRIIICSDGTWNTPEKYTNVTKMVRAIQPVAEDGKHQVVFYDQGVGTSNFVDKFLGGAFGKGVEQNVLDAYRFIAHNYQKGDELYLFGFSRGAYTVRALGGMLHTIGLLPKTKLDQLPRAYRFYRTPPNKRNDADYSLNLRPEITCIGVWDTVGALGAPTPLLSRLTRPLVGFFNTHLSPDIKHAFQALAIDEKRAPFKPALWTGNINPDQSVEQVWFAGVHSDVGGGYKDRGLSDIAFMWMVEKARALGLCLSQDYLDKQTAPNPLGPIHDSYNWFYRGMDKIFEYNGVRSLLGDNEEKPLNVAIHDSVVKRITEVNHYEPENFVASLPVVSTSSFLKSGERRSKIRELTNDLLGKIETEEKSHQCKILDYSPDGGVKVLCESDLELAHQLSVSSVRFNKITANCRWKKGNTYGLQFAA